MTGPPKPVDAAIARLGGGDRLIAAPADLVDGGRARRARSRRRARGGRLDILVNNAAVNVERPIEATDDAHWDLHLAVDPARAASSPSRRRCRC